MSIRSKLALTFILLLIFGITAISSYSILFIRNYLLEEGERQIESDARWLEVTIQNLPANERFETQLNEAAQISGYRIALYDEEGVLYAAVPFDQVVEVPELLSPARRAELQGESSVRVENRSASAWLIAYIAVQDEGGERRFLQIAQLKEQIYAPIKTIRWIIYTGMFISIGLVLLVSVLFARYLTRPLLQLEETARSIAEGDVDRSIQLNRDDEFGTLAESLNRMALRLRKDNEEMKRIYEKQSQFFADITHELRNPLHTVSGALEMLQMETLSKEKKEHYLRTATRQIERINRLFKDLVTLQRYESDTDFIEKREFEMAPMLYQLHELLAPAAAGKGITLKLNVEPCRVYADPDKIEQVLENLVSNAIKYTSEGKIELICKVDERGAAVVVRDTGIGISEEHLHRLFDRFYRTDKARSRDQGGTGLGLAVVRGILAAHSVEIQVESEVGRGSTFSFVLPLAEASRG
ncbi:MAG: HAMP domain-containing sensor histidine kinase [Balneolaceae bacterium]